MQSHAITDGGKTTALIAPQPAVITNGTSYRSMLLGRRGYYSFTGSSSSTVDGVSKSGNAPFFSYLLHLLLGKMINGFELFSRTVTGWSGLPKVNHCDAFLQMKILPAAQSMVTG